MTHKELISMIKPYLKKDDKPFNRQIFNNTKDSLHKAGLITDKQCNNWIYPQTKLFK